MFFEHNDQWKSSDLIFRSLPEKSISRILSLFVFSASNQILLPTVPQPDYFQRFGNLKDASAKFSS
jgi:hypothetical protein